MWDSANNLLLDEKLLYQCPGELPIAEETRDSQIGDARMDDIAKMVFLLSIGTIVGTLVVVMIIRKVRSMICFTFQMCTRCGAGIALQGVKTCHICVSNGVKTIRICNSVCLLSFSVAKSPLLCVCV